MPLCEPRMKVTLKHLLVQILVSNKIYQNSRSREEKMKGTISDRTFNNHNAGSKSEEYNFNYYNHNDLSNICICTKPHLCYPENMLIIHLDRNTEPFDREASSWLGRK